MQNSLTCSLHEERAGNSKRKTGFFPFPAFLFTVVEYAGWRRLLQQHSDNLSDIHQMIVLLRVKSLVNIG